MKVKYEFDSGAIGLIQVSKAKGAVASNTVPTAAVDTKLRASMSKNKGEAGVKPRYVSLTRTINVTAPTPAFDVVKTSTLAILSKSVFDGATFDVGKTVTINSIVWTVADKFPESY